MKKRASKKTPQREVLENIKGKYDKRALELIAKAFETILTNLQIRNVISPIIDKNKHLYNEKDIKGYIIDERLEEYPFYTFNDTLQIILKKCKNASEVISTIISELLNPLNYRANSKISNQVADEIEKYLKYCNFSIIRTKNKYIVVTEDKNSLNEDSYQISIKDREIRINDYLISTPFATGENLTFLEYVTSKPVGTEITKENMPENFKPHKHFTKILNELRFEGEILKAFFPKRAKSTLVFRGKSVTGNDLREAGVNMKKFIEQLESANRKKNPK